MNRRTMLHSCIGGLISSPLYAAPLSVSLIPLAMLGRNDLQSDFLDCAKNKLQQIYKAAVVVEPTVICEQMSHGIKLLDFLRDAPRHNLGVMTGALYGVFGKINDREILKEVSGYGRLLGTESVITTYWRCRTVPRSLALARFADLAVHEVAHNYGAVHCSEKICTMYHDPTIVSSGLTPVDGKFCAEHRIQLSPYLR